jgi:hypothetical protein
VAGLLAPLIGGGEFVFRDAFGVSEEAWANNHIALGLLGAFRTAAPVALNTVLYAVGAGCLATLFATLIAFAVGRSAQLRVAALIGCIVLFSWPAAASACRRPRSARARLRCSTFFSEAVSPYACVGLHFAPSRHPLLRATAAIPPTWTYAAAIHGVRLRRCLQRVLLPALPSAALSLALLRFSLGGCGDRSPPSSSGEASLALAIVTVMANAPEASNRVAVPRLPHRHHRPPLSRAALGIGEKRT